ncbi:MAG: hypothetical protein HWN68_13245 [Desulfobacterales bacterium]|nr:hypothetical protein [Desulfobacterales bacterium]
MSDKLVSAILSYGNRYREEILRRDYTEAQLLSNWWDATKFFLGRAFFQGRRDDVSQKVHDTALKILEAYFAHEHSMLRYQRMRETNWQDLRQELYQNIGKGKVGKPRDVEMVVSTLEFIGRLENLNIVAYSVKRIKGGEIAKHYEEIQHTKNKSGIVQVGPKIASFYLRDAVSLFELESNVADDFQFCLQPIDIWVRKFAIKTGIVPHNTTDEQIRSAIIGVCRERACSPLQFNQGAWYCGYFAFDLLLESLMAQGA